jgi:tRNA(Ile)-lysidine synthase
VKSLRQRVYQTICHVRHARHARMIVPGDRLAVALSGGADSVALFRLLLELRDSLGITLLAAHFDHTLRGAESAADAQFVAELCRSHNIELFLDREDVAAIAKRNKWNVEDAARRLRYDFFSRLVEEGKATRVAVAHTADDQAETVLMHLLQGTGLAGLAGIYPIVDGPVADWPLADWSAAPLSAPIAREASPELLPSRVLTAPRRNLIVRPLLDERRAELRKYLSQTGQEWREDSSNRDLSRLRARIRERLVPLLEKEFTPHLATRLCRLARLAREEEEFWTALLDDRVASLVVSQEGQFRIKVRDLLLPMALSASSELPAKTDSSHSLSQATSQLQSQPLRVVTERLVRHLYHRLRGDRRGLTADHVERVIRFASESTSGHRVELPGSVTVERVFDHLIFARSAPAIVLASKRETQAKPRAFQYIVTLSAAGSVAVSVPELNRRFLLKVIDWSTVRRDTKRDCTVLDADRLRSPLVLRNWRPGDAYRPQGRRRVQKLKRLFLAHRIPSRQRPLWPLLESGGEVAWVRGMPVASDFCVDRGTRNGVVIEEALLEAQL